MKKILFAAMMFLATAASGQTKKVSELSLYGGSAFDSAQFVGNILGTTYRVAGWHYITDTSLLVHKSNDETINGTKTFVSDIFANGQPIGDAGLSGSLRFGYQTLNSITSGSSLLAIGQQALINNTSGFSNSVVGNYAGAYITSGQYNTLNGEAAGQSVTTGSRNTFTGWSAGYQSSPAANPSFATVTGFYGGRHIGGQYNTGYGYAVFGGNAPTVSQTGNDNACMGANSMTGLTTGGTNSVFGNSAGTGITTGSGNLVLGFGADIGTGSSSNQMSIQNIIYGVSNSGTGSTISTGNIGIGVKVPTEKLDVDGNIKSSGNIASVTFNGIKKYVAILTQTGTSAPVATVLENSLGGTVTWNYDNIAQYHATSTALFTTGKTVIVGGMLQYASDINADDMWMKYIFDDANTISLYLQHTDGTNGNDSFLGSSATLMPNIVTILVYP